MGLLVQQTQIQLQGNTPGSRKVAMVIVYKLIIQLGKVLNVDYHELGDTSSTFKSMFLRRLEHVFTGEDVSDVLSWLEIKERFYDVERSNNLAIVEVK